MRQVSRQELLTMAQTIIQQPEFKIPESQTDQHPLTAVSCVVLMSYVMIQLIELRSQGKVPNNLSPEEQKITEFLLKKSQFPAHAPYLRVFLQKIREQLIQVTQAFYSERVPQNYPAKNKLIELYDYLLRDSLMLHPTCPFFAAKKEIPLQPFESLLGFYLIEIEIKQLVEVNDALSPYFRTLLGIWQKPDALKTPMTAAGLAAQHIDWGGSLSSLSWVGLPTLSFLTPPSIKTFVYKPEYQGLVFSSELRDFLVTEIKLNTEAAQVKRMSVQLLKTHEKLHTDLLKEHGLTRHAQLEKKENRISSEGEEEKDITLTFAESSIHQINVQRKTDLAAAIKAMESALDKYLEKATGRVSLATLARRIKGWYERTPEIVSPLENLLSQSDPTIGGVMTMSESRSSVGSTSTSVARPLSSSSVSTSSTTSSMTGSVVQRPLSSITAPNFSGRRRQEKPAVGR